MNLEGDFYAPIAWSPDGTRVAAENWDGDLVVQTAGGEPIAVIPAGNPTWSPDGRLPVETDDGWDLVDPVTMARMPIPDQPTAWSPDGREFVTVRDLGAELGKSQEIVVFETDGSSSRKLTDVPEADVALDWSPDGRQIVFSSARKDRLSEVYVIGADGTRERQLTFSEVGEQATSPRWSLDGREIVYLRGRFGTDMYGNHDVYDITSNGTRREALTLAFPDGGDNTSPSWIAAPVSRTEAGPGIAVPTPTTTESDGVGDLSADGATVAYAEVRPGYGCGPVTLWMPLDNRRLALPRRCAFDASYTGQTVRDLALTNELVAWVFTWLDRYEGEDCLLGWVVAPDLENATSMNRHRGRLCADFYRDPGFPALQVVYNGGTSPEGTALENVVGDSGHLVFNSRHWCVYECYEPAGPSTGKLWRIGARHTHLIRKGATSIDVAAADSGRLVVVTRPGPLLILDNHGKLRSRIALRRGTAKGAKLQGNDLVVMTAYSLDVYDAAAGTRHASWPLRRATGPQPILEDVQDGIAAYVAGVATHLVRLSDGRDITLDLPDAGPPAHAQLEADGLYFSYNQPHSSRPGRHRIRAHGRRYESLRVIGMLGDKQRTTLLGILLVLLTPATPAAAGADWVQTGPEGGPVSALALAPSRPETLYAAFDGFEGIFKTLDGGASWVQVGAEYADVLAVDPADPNRVYAGTSSGVDRSEDGGVTWTPTPLPDEGVDAIAIDPVDSRIVYTSTAAGLFRSEDEAHSWKRIVPGNIYGAIWALALDPSHSGILYAGLWEKGLSKSTDGGESWNPIGDDRFRSERLIWIAVSPVDSDLLWAATTDHVWKSVNGGLTFTTVLTPYGDGYVKIVLDPDDPSIAYVTDSASIARTQNGGATWELFDDNVSRTRYEDILIDPERRSTLYAATRAGIARSVDAGRSWTLENTGAEPGRDGQSLAFDPSEPETVFAGSTAFSTDRRTPDTPGRFSTAIPCTGLSPTSK